MRKIDYSSELPIIENFYTLQGEGFNSGRASYFIRLAGCDVGCSWCDSRESWSLNNGKIVKITTLLSQAKEAEAKTVVITGGEPLMHPLDAICSLFKAEGFELLLESSGSRELSGEFDWICLSPKRRKPPVESLYKKASELKIIIENSDDFIWAQEQSILVNSKAILYLQPEWNSREWAIGAIVEYIKKNPKWRLSLQTHKYIDIP